MRMSFRPQGILRCSAATFLQGYEAINRIRRSIARSRDHTEIPCDHQFCLDEFAGEGGND